MGRCARVFLVGILAAGLGCVRIAYAQGEAQSPQNPPSDQNSAKKAAKQRAKSDKELKKELDSQYKKWLDEDVVYIISPEERSAFLHLATNEEREQFIEQFWQRRNPDPDSADNTFKEEHYRRIAYANEHFSSGIPGWKADRGRIYIIWGPPDEIQSHPTGGSYDRPPEEGGGSTSTYPFEDWRYRYLEGIGIDGPGEQDGSLQQHRRITSGAAAGNATGGHGRIRAAGAVLQDSAGAAGEVQGFGSGGIFACFARPGEV